MAKLIGVCRDDRHEFAPRQLPLLVDESLTLVVDFSDSCLACDHVRITQKDVDKFKSKFKLLSPAEQINSLTVSTQDLVSTVSQIVPCVGCRKSVERLFHQLTESGHPSIEPLSITADGEITVFENLLQRPKALTALFLLHGQKLNEVIDSIPKTKKSRRCVVHSLDSQHAKPPSWKDVWDQMSHECREEVLVVECDDLKETLESFLKKHRFCGECKVKVMKAYSILVGDVEAPNDEGYAPSLYQGIRCCPKDAHVHVDCNVDFITSLIQRAQPEIQGSRRERHAKTLEMAQEEVLICLGVCVYERMATVWQRLRDEEQTWQLLFYLGIHCIRQRFELAVEKMQGFSQLELLCEEISRAEQAKQLRKENKRQKRRRRKNKVEKIPEKIADSQCEEQEEENHHSCEDEEDWEEAVIITCPVECRCETSRCSSGFCEHDHRPQDCSSSNSLHICSQCSCLSVTCSSEKVNSSYSDCGYSSGTSHESSWSTSSSCESSEVACTEGFCNHEGEIGLCNSLDNEIPPLSKDSCSSALIPPNRMSTLFTRKHNPLLKLYNVGPSLQDMLQESTMKEKDLNDPYVIPAELARLQAQLPQLKHKRLELRQKLRQQFAELQNSSRQLLIRPRNTVSIGHHLLYGLG